MLNSRYCCVVTGAVNIGWHFCPLLVSRLCAAVLGGIWGDKIHHTFSACASLKTRSVSAVGCATEKGISLKLMDRLALVNTLNPTDLLQVFTGLTEPKNWRLSVKLGSLFLTSLGTILRKLFLHK